MNAYDLPTSLTIGGVEQSIRTGWRTVMDIFAMFNDPEFDKEMKTVGLIKILYPNWRQIPPEAMGEAIEKACDFLDCGQKPDNRPRPRLMSWEDDAPLIIPAINDVAGKEVRDDPNIHWWTFFGWYMSVENSLFSTVLHIRKKQASGKKLEQWEKDFYRENTGIVNLKKRRTAEEQATMDAIERWLNGEE